MRVALYVHDFRLEVGHSNSLIELIRHLPDETKRQIETIEVVSCRTSPLEILFPDFRGKLVWTKVPLEKVKPSFLKSLMFQIWTLFYNKIFQEKNTYRIGVGICSLNVDAVSIQFIHHQWTKQGLEMEKEYFLRSVYKKLLFKYYEICENFLFVKAGLKLFSPAQFLTDFLKRKYPGIEAATIYSGVNLNRFEISARSKQELKNRLMQKYSVLKDLNTEAPIFLFVGAYERKGLLRALKILSNHPGSQFIVVGSPSFGRITDWPSNLKIFTITFSNEISDFYSLADAFIFPTLYEPFGLVLFEAMAMGLAIITCEAEVGASELLKGLPEVYFLDKDHFQLPVITVKSAEEKKALRNERIELLGDVSWDKAGRELSQFIFDEKLKGKNQ